MIKYDLLIKNGTLVDAANAREGRYDIAVADGKVSDVEPELNPDQAREVFDASGMMVFPGLVDTHVHLTPYSRAVGFRMLAKGISTRVADLENSLFYKTRSETMASQV